MSDSATKIYFQFPPNPDVPEIEYLSLASDLPHFSFEAKLESDLDKNDFYYLKSNKKQNKDDLNSKISGITQCVTTLSTTPSHAKLFQTFTVSDFKGICTPNAWMKDNTVQILTKWFNIVSNRYSGKCFVRSGWVATTIVSHFNSYIQSQSGNESDNESKQLK